MLRREGLARRTQDLVCHVRVGRRQKRVTIGTYPALSLAEARGEARKRIRDAQLGLLNVSTESPALTLGETVPLFVELYAKPKNRGWTESERLLRKFQALLTKPLGQIARTDVVRVLDQIIASGTPYRANRALAALKKLRAWALDHGMIDVNPIAGLKPPDRERAREVVLSDEDIISLMAAADDEGYPFGYVFKMLILTGQRRGEVAEMRWSEVDLERGVWTIPAARLGDAAPALRSASTTFSAVVRANLGPKSASSNVLGLCSSHLLGFLLTCSCQSS